MAAEFAARELDRVRLAPRAEDEEEESRHSDSELESFVGEDEGDVDYDVEAIKWAIWRDSTKDRSDGWVGWHYGVLWTDYLKTQSETEEPKRSFTGPNSTAGDLVKEFWTSLDLNEHPWAVLNKAQREPRKPPYGMIGRRIETPERLLRKKFDKMVDGVVKMRRAYETFAARQRWLKDNGLYDMVGHMPRVPKRVSDYYQRPKAEALHSQRKKERKEKKKKKAADEALAAKRASKQGTSVDQQAPADPGPSNSARPTSSPTHLSTLSAETVKLPTPSSTSAIPPVAANSGTRRPINASGSSRASSLDSLFDDVPTATAPSTLQPPGGPLTSKGTKRKIVGSPGPEPERKVARTQKGDVGRPTTVKTSTATLARIGKIAKRSEEVSLTPSIQPSFGDPQPGIFDQFATMPSTLSPPAPPVSAVSVQPAEGARTILPPTSTRGPPGVPAQTSKLFIDPEDNTPAVSPAATRPFEVKPEPVSAVAGSSATSVSPAEPNAKAPLSDRPKYQQASKIKVIEGVPLTVHPRRKPSTGSGTIGGASPVDPGIRPLRKSPVAPYGHGQSPSSGGRTPVASGNATPGEPRSAVFVPRAPAPGPSYQPSGPTSVAIARPPQMPAVAPSSLQSFPPSAPTQPRNFRPSRPVPGDTIQARPNLPSPPRPNSRPIPTGPSSVVYQGPGRPPSPPRPNPLDPRPLLDTAAAYNPAADPRRKPSHTSPILPSKTSPLSPPRPPGGRTPTDPPSGSRPRMQSNASFADFAKSLQITAKIPIHDPDLTSLDMHLVPGAKLSSGLSSLSEKLLRHETGKAVITFEEVEPIAITGNIRLGAQLVEWVRASRIAREDAGSKAYSDNWLELKVQMKANKVYVAYADLEATNLKHHYAFLLASPSVLDLSHIGYGQFRIEDVTAGIFILQLPLTSGPPPQLSNPVIPTMPNDEKPDLKKGVPQPADILGSYGISSDFFNQYRGRRVVKYPVPDHRLDILDRQLTAAFKQNEIQGVAPRAPPDFVVLLNHGVGRSLRSSTMRSAVLRRTPIYACGPSLNVYPSQYSNQQIWREGALVTFSPTFMLHSPDRFAAAMRLVRLSPTWAAYITPGVIEWCQASWSIPARCPDTAIAYRELNKALVFDAALLKISGSHESGGDLAVSCAPPCIHDTEGCAAWQSWVFKVASQTNFDGIVSVCEGVTSQTFKTDSVDDKESASLDLVDIEQGQLEDLTAMRMKPHLLPYRRYLYVGEVSLPQAEKDRLGANIEFILAGSFTATFSSVI